MSRAVRLLDEILHLLGRLHRLKDRAYGDAWRKRGEVLGIFSNIARKYDRLLVAMEEEVPAAVESIGDTVADLCVYAGKYVTWLAETEPTAFATVGLDVRPDDCNATRGPGALDAVFDALAPWAAKTNQIPTGADDAFGQVRDSFRALEQDLMTQAEGGAGATAQEKVQLALALTNATAWLLVHMSSDDAVYLEMLRTQVEHREASE